MNSKPGWLVVFRDTVIFTLGVLIIARQAGIFFDPPIKVSIELLITGAVMANVPGALHVLAWRFGTPTGSPSLPPGPLPPEQQRGRLSAPSSGGEG